MKLHGERPSFWQRKETTNFWANGVLEKVGPVPESKKTATRIMKVKEIQIDARELFFAYIDNLNSSRYKKLRAAA